MPEFSQESVRNVDPGKKSSHGLKENIPRRKENIYEWTDNYLSHVTQDEWSSRAFIVFLRNLVKLQSSRAQFEDRISQKFDTLVYLLAKTLEDRTCFNRVELEGAFLLLIQLKASQRKRAAGGRKKRSLVEKSGHKRVGESENNLTAQEQLVSIEKTLVQHITSQVNAVLSIPYPDNLSFLNAWIYSFQNFYLRELEDDGRRVLISCFSSLIRELKKHRNIHDSIRFIARGCRFLFYRKPGAEAIELIKEVTTIISNATIHMSSDKPPAEHLEALCAFISYHRDFWEGDQSGEYHIHLNTEFVLSAVNYLSEHQSALLPKHAHMLLSLIKFPLKKSLPLGGPFRELTLKIKHIVEQVLVSQRKNNQDLSYQRLLSLATDLRLLETPDTYDAPEATV